MRLEEALHVQGFRNEQQRAIINLYYSNSLISFYFKEVLKPFGITSQQFNILRILKGQYPEAVRIGLVKERMIEQNSDTTRLIERLLQKELIDKSICQHDKRQFHLSITPKGLELLQQLEEKVAAFENTIDLTDGELAQFNTLLDRIRQAFLPQP